MREIGALFRAAWVTETRYRLTMALSLSPQSQQYFAFLLSGATIYTFVAACTSALPNALAGAIGRGTLEAFLGTPTRLAVLFTGLSGYSILWALLRALVMIAAGTALGARITFGGFPILAVIVLLLVLAYGAF